MLIIKGMNVKIRFERISVVDNFWHQLCQKNVTFNLAYNFIKLTYKHDFTSYVL